MKKISLFLISIFCICLISACSSKEDSIEIQNTQINDFSEKNTENKSIDDKISYVDLEYDEINKNLTLLDLGLNPGGDGLQGQLVVKVDIHHHRDGAVLLDFPHRPGGLHIGDGHPDNLTPGGGQLPYLPQGSLHVLGGGVGHGLDGDRGAPADGDAAHVDLSGHGRFTS